MGIGHSLLENNLSFSAGHASPTQPSMLITWLAMRVHSWVHVQLGTRCNLQVIFNEAAIQMFVSWPIQCVQLFHLRSRLPTELYEVSPGPVLKYIKIPLEYSSAICHVNHSPLIYYPLQICWGCTLCHDLGHWWRHSLPFTDRYPLSLLVQSVPNPVSSCSPLFLSFQTRVLWETVLKALPKSAIACKWA